jgi:hypothetical protein
MSRITLVLLALSATISAFPSFASTSTGHPFGAGTSHPVAIEPVASPFSGDVEVPPLLRNDLTPLRVVKAPFEIIQALTGVLLTRHFGS